MSEPLVPQPAVSSVPARRAGQFDPRLRKTFAITMGVSILTSSLGDIALKKGVGSVPDLSIRSFAAVAHSIALVVSDLWLVIGIVLMLLHFVAFVRALRLAPLSLVVPLRSTTYILTTLLAQSFLRERVTLLRWGGILVILVGVSMVGWSAGGEHGDA